MAAQEDVMVLGQTTIDTMMPMFLDVAADGKIRRAGPTLRKLRPDVDLIGASLWDVFEIRRPRNVHDFDTLLAKAGDRIQLRLKPGGEHDLKGVIMPLPGGNGVFLNLGFGISVVDAVSKYALTAGDFSPTDLTIEMLYLVEAKSAVLEESRQLNQRLQGAKIAAEEQAFTDTLTGLKNRRAMDHVLSRLIASGEGFALMHLDLDFFKDVNDTLGHAAGDHVLQAVAKVLVSETRDDDTIARVGGDEFILLLTRTTDTARLARTAERIIAKLEEPVIFDGKPCRISGSIGITTTEFYGELDGDRMQADADAALYASKHKGRACATIFDPDKHNAFGAKPEGMTAGVAR